jgi:hypothetical protein
MYKPAEDNRDSMEFAYENFKFCVASKTSEYLSTIFGAMFEVLRKQMGAADVMTNVMKVLRSQLNTIYAPFSAMMDKFWNKFKQIGSLSSRIFQHTYMSMKKAAATAIASLYVAMSLQTALLNGIDLVINIIMIVLYILIALAIIFFLPILPVMFFVVMAVNGIESGFPGRTGGMGAVFCFAADTPVVLETYRTKQISEIQLGDILLNGQTVEAVIELPGTLDGMYSIHGVSVSGDHRIWFEKVKKWILVKDHPEAVKTNIHESVLWTLITTNRQIPVLSSKSVLLFADWEELPNTDYAAKVWEDTVREILMSKVSHATVPLHPPCFDKSIKVKKFQGGWVPISEIRRDDWIMGDARWTRVLGVCNRKVYGGIGNKGGRITDGVWVRGTVGKWTHVSSRFNDAWDWEGVNLITDCGTFRIMVGGLQKEISVRDFTEVGWSRLPDTYVRVERAMDKLKQS